MEAYHFAGVIATILYFIIVPESPVWYILRDGLNSPDAIASLNYIAWFNGSSYRVPPNARIGLSLETTVQSQRRDNSISMSVSAMQRSMLNLTSMTVDRASKRTDFSKAFVILRELYSCSEESWMHMKLQVLFACMCFVYTFILFYSFEIAGDPLNKGVFFGIGEGLGVLLVDRIINYVPDTQGAVFCFPMIALLATALMNPHLDETLLYLILMFQIMSVGFCWNVTWVIQESRTKPKYAAMSLELNACFSNLLASMTPFVAS